MQETLNRVTQEDCMVLLPGAADEQFTTWPVIWIHDQEDDETDGLRMAALGGEIGTIIPWHFGSRETDQSRTLPDYLPHDEVNRVLRELIIELAAKFPGLKFSLPHPQLVPDGVPTVWAFAPTDATDIENVVRQLIKRLGTEEHRLLRRANPGTHYDQPLPGEEAS